MGKSEFKEVVVRHAMSSKMDESKHADVVLCDAVVALRRWGHMAESTYTRPVSLEQMVYDVFRPYVLKHSRCKCFVFAFDKCSYVSKAKQHEQMSRDSRVRSHAGNLPESIPSKALGTTWCSLISDRRMRQQLISALCGVATEQLAGMLLQLRRTADIVLDFEHREGDTGCAHLVQVCYTGGVLSDCREFANELGEFDVLFPHYAYSPSFASKCVAIDSIDTDMLPIAMLHCGHREQLCELYCVLPHMNRSVWFNVQHCVDAFVAKLDRSVQDSMKLLCELYIHSGSDFVEPCPGISASAFVEDYLSNFRQLSLSEYRRRLVGSGLQKLSGTRLASKTAQSKRSVMDADMCSRRAEYTVNYWLHSTFETDKLIHSPIGYGFSLVGGKVLPTESIHSVKRQRVK